MLVTADEGDLNTAAWAVWILSWLAGAVIAVVGLGVGATRIARASGHPADAVVRL